MGSTEDIVEALVADTAQLLPHTQRDPSWRRVYYMIRNNECGLNAEPLTFLLTIVYGIFLSVSPIFIFWARCVEIYGGLTDIQNATAFCGKISVLNEIAALNYVEQDVSRMSVYLQLCNTITSLVGSTVIGVWSDYHGRRKPLITSITALTIYIFIQTLAIFTYDRLNIYYLLFVAEIFVGCMGGVAMTASVISAIIIDDSRKKLVLSGVPWRVIVACAGRGLGNITGAVLYSLLAVPITVSSENHVNGFIRTYLAAFFICLLSLAFAIFRVRETHNVTVVVEEGQGFVQNVWHYTLDTFRVFTHKRIGWTRLSLWLVISFMFVDFVNLDNSLQYMYFKRPPFGWTDELFNRYLIFKNIITAIGVVALPMFVGLLNCIGKETVMLIMSLLSNSISTLIISTAQSTETIFMAIPLFLIGSGTIPGFDTVLSKMVAKSETARLFSVVAMLLVVCPLFSKAVFYRLYGLTMESHPGLVFFVVSILIFITFVGQIMVYFLMRKQWAENERSAVEGEAGEAAADGSTQPNSSDQETISIS